MRNLQSVLYASLTGNATCSGLERDKTGNTWLHVYVRKHRLDELLENVDLFHLLGLGKIVVNKEGKTWVAVAVENMDTPQEEQALIDKIQMNGVQFKPILNIRDNNNDTLLHLVVRKSLKHLARVLLAKIPNPNTQFNSFGHNPLHTAVQRNDAEMVKVLLETPGDDLDVNYPNVNGESPLAMTATLGQVEVTEELLRHGADLSLTDSQKQTPLHTAAKQGNADLLRVFITYGGDLSAQDIDGHTPLHDCLQQVYYEGGAEDEDKCEKFIRVWNLVILEAVTWWTQKTSQQRPNDKTEFSRMQTDALYFLRSCIYNKRGMSVLQYAAARGLIPCVQVMMITEDIFVIQRDQIQRSYEIDVTNLCPEFGTDTSSLYNMGYNNLTTVGTKSEKGEDLTRRNVQQLFKIVQKFKDNYPTFTHAVNKTKPPSKAGAILESIPMVEIAKSEWQIYQLFSLLWLLWHICLMTLVSLESQNEISWNTSQQDNSTVVENSWRGYTLDVILLLYSGLFFLLHFTWKLVKIFPKIGLQSTSFHHLGEDTEKNSERKAKNQDDEETDTEYEDQNSTDVESEDESTTLKDDNGLLNFAKRLLKFILDESEILVKFLFFGFVVAAFLNRFIEYDTFHYAWIKGFLLLIGWLFTLIPLRSYSVVFQLLSILKYNVILDMFPWTLVYFTISLGFATAIQLQFRLLEMSESCQGEEPSLTGFMQVTRHALFELLIMTAGLDTDLAGVRSIACQFSSRSEKLLSLLASSSLCML